MFGVLDMAFSFVRPSSLIRDHVGGIAAPQGAHNVLYGKYLNRCSIPNHYCFEKNHYR